MSHNENSATAPRRRASDCVDEIARHDKSAAACFADLDRRVERVETKIDTLDGTVNRLDGDVREFRDSGCAYRAEEARRIDQLEASMANVRETVGAFKDAVSEFRIEVVKEIAGIRAWVLVGACSILAAALLFLSKEYVWPELRHQKQSTVTTTSPTGTTTTTQQGGRP